MVVNSMPRALDAWDVTIGNHNTGDWLNSRVGLDGCGEDKMFSSPGFEIRIFQPVATHYNYVEGKGKAVP